MLVVSDDDHGSGCEWGMGSPVPEIGEVVELSLNSMKVNEGTIAQQVVVVMIDCGATHNFISAELVRRLGIPSKGTRSHGVLMGTGLTVKGAGICKGVVLTLQNIEVVEDFLPSRVGPAPMSSSVCSGWSR